jgi:SSS family solute:Na+ symporter
LTVAGLAVHEVGGFAGLYQRAGEAMHLHLPNSHPQLPWLGIITMNLLNLQYWGCNQVILQRSLAARSLRDAQVGLLVGGFFKLVTAAMLVLPGIALIGILGDERRLADPDQAYLAVVDMLLAPGVKGLVLCGLFASLMSSVDSIFNSISTLWSVDIYKRHLRPDASDGEVVAVGRRAILVVMLIGIACAFLVAYVKLANPALPVDPLFKKTSYFIKNGFVILIAAAVFLVSPPRRLMLAALVLMVPITIGLNLVFRGTPYLILTMVIIVAGFAIVAIPTLMSGGWRLPDDTRILAADSRTGWLGAVLAIGLVLVHVAFH